MAQFFKDHTMKTTGLILFVALASCGVMAAEKPADNADKQAWCRHVLARVLAVNPAPGEGFIARCANFGRGVDYYKCVDREMDRSEDYTAAGDGCGRRHP